MPVRPVLAWPSVVALFAEYAVIAVCFAAASWAWNPVVVALAFIVIATRQHALFILYHDAVHGLFARSLRVNDLLVNLFVGVPLLVPVHVYRALHLTHHAHLGTPRDPERVLLYRGQLWAYRPLPLVRLAAQLAGDASGVFGLRMLAAYVQERRDPASTLELPVVRVFPETWALLAAWLGALAALAWVDLGLFARFALLWFVPFLTVVQAIQKVRSFAEHDHPDATERSYTWRPGLLGRLVVWPYNIGYHREHHVYPTLPWFVLPSVGEPDGRPGSALVGLLWNGRLR